MTNWTTIPDGNIDAGSPLRDVDLMALRDNPVAIAERANGAPWQNIGNIVTLTGNGTWTVPVGVYRLIVTCVGGGQGGGIAQMAEGSGGVWTTGSNGRSSSFGSVVASGGNGTSMSGLVSNNGGRGVGLHGMGGQIVRQSLNVTPGQNIPYIVGAGGAACHNYGTAGGGGLIIIEW